MMNRKIVKRIERVLKGAANSKRIEILKFIERADETTLWQISQELNYDFRLTSHHAGVLEKAGLIEKRYVGRSVMHCLTPYGEKAIDFMKSLE